MRFARMTSVLIVLIRKIMFNITGQMVQVKRRLSLVREASWGSNLEPIKYSACCQLLATVATLMCGPWRKDAEMDTAHS